MEYEIYNSFPKADSIYLEWQDRVDHTDTIPSQWQTLSLAPEQFNCFDDLSFPTGLSACYTGENRISYRVLHISKPSNLYVYNIGLRSVLYEGDITNNVAPYNIIHDCETYEMRACVDSGLYTFVTFVISLKLLKVSPIVEEDIHGPLLLSLVFGVAVPSMNKVIYKFILSLRSNIIKKYEAILAITSMCTYISIIIFFFYG